jgi:uncharacterized membrane protein
MNWLPCGCYDKLFVCLQQIYYLRKKLQKTASALFVLIEMERKSSLPEKIAKDVEEVTSRLLLKKSRDAVQFSLNCLIKRTRTRRRSLIMGA